MLAQWKHPTQLHTRKQASEQAHGRPSILQNVYAEQDANRIHRWAHQAQRTSQADYKERSAPCLVYKYSTLLLWRPTPSGHWPPIICMTILPKFLNLQYEMFRLQRPTAKLGWQDHGAEQSVCMPVKGWTDEKLDSKGCSSTRGLTSLWYVARRASSIRVEYAIFSSTATSFAPSPACVHACKSPILKLP